jgi:hypothetical protein
VVELFPAAEDDSVFGIGSSATALSFLTFRYSGPLCHLLGVCAKQGALINRTAAFDFDNLQKSMLLQCRELKELALIE